jgi:hypothetical protein
MEHSEERGDKERGKLDRVAERGSTPAQAADEEQEEGPPDMEDEAAEEHRDGGKGAGDRGGEGTGEREERDITRAERIEPLAGLRIKAKAACPGVEAAEGVDADGEREPDQTTGNADRIPRVEEWSDRDERGAHKERDDVDLALAQVREEPTREDGRCHHGTRNRCGAESGEGEEEQERDHGKARPHEEERATGERASPAQVPVAEERTNPTGHDGQGEQGDHGASTLVGDVAELFDEGLEDLDDRLAEECEDADGSHGDEGDDESVLRENGGTMTHG